MGAAELADLDVAQVAMEDAVARLEAGSLSRDEEASFNSRVTAANDRFDGVIHRAAGNERLLRILVDLHQLARAAGVAPIPASSGNTQRQRLDQGSNRQINAALHRVIVTRARCHQPTRDYIARRRAEGKSTREPIRCLKRFLARRVWRLLLPNNPETGHPHRSRS